MTAGCIGYLDHLAQRKIWPHLMHTTDLTPSEVAMRLSPILRQFAGNLYSARKRISVLVGIHPRVAKNYIEGTRSPPLNKFIELAAACPQLADELMAMIEERRQQRQADADPDL